MSACDYNVTFITLKVTVMFNDILCLEILKNILTSFFIEIMFFTFLWRGKQLFQQTLLSCS